MYRVVLTTFLVSSLLSFTSFAQNEPPALTQKQQHIFAKQLINAHHNKHLTPHISSFVKDISTKEAYEIQIKYVSLRQTQDQIAGYKAGLTSKVGQLKFNVKEPLSGALFLKGLIQDTNNITLSDAGKLMLETEIGFFLDKPINSTIESIDELKATVSSIAAVIELPDLGYQNLTKLTGADLIAANLASHQYIIGNKLNLNSAVNLNQITTKLSLNGEPLFSGKATDALGDQWFALQWLVNHLIKTGYKLAAGDLLITGALGEMTPAKPGNYVAEYGPLGKIEFIINAN